MAEMIDIYNDRRETVGTPVERKTAFMKEGQYMMYVLALLERPDHTFLITRRSLDKKWAAGAWEVSGGAADAGESSYEAIVREVREETGLDVTGPGVRAGRPKGAVSWPLPEDRGQPMPIYSYVNVDLRRGDNYFVDIYHFTFDFQDSDVNIQKSEAIDHRFASLEEISAMNEEKAFLHYTRICEALGNEEA